MLQERLDSDLKNSMRSKNAARTRTLRSIRAALQQKEIEKRGKGEKGLTEAEILAVLQKQAKQREDSIEQFAQGGRPDLESSEREELEIIREYLPAQASDEEIRSVVEMAIEAVGAESIADMGRVMGNAMAALKGKADGRRINQVVKDLLSKTH
ncbi:MAG: GatB/YqeY domain-containing protein [Rhodothermales bacterium]|nr:GatB/YqeY domain-containing protein [Rhodothermales bacterium]